MDDFIAVVFSVLVISQLPLAILTGALAARKNRNGPGWFLLANLLTWPIALPAVAFLSALCPRCRAEMTRDQLKRLECPACGSLQTSSSALDGVTEDDEDATCSRCGVTYLTSRGFSHRESGRVCPNCVRREEKAA